MYWIIKGKRGQIPFSLIKKLTEKLEIDIIELPKIEGKKKESGKLLDWLYLLENPKPRRVTEKMEEKLKKT